MSNQSLTARGTDMPFSHKSVVSITHEQNSICSKTLICSQLYAGYVVGVLANEKEGKMHRMIIHQPFDSQNETLGDTKFSNF